MTAAIRLLLLLIVVAIFVQLIWAQESREVTIKEPGIYELAELFKRADTVALVKVVAGPTMSPSTRRRRSRTSRAQ